MAYADGPWDDDLIERARAAHVEAYNTYVENTNRDPLPLIDELQAPLYGSLLNDISEVMAELYLMTERGIRFDDGTRLTVVDSHGGELYYITIRFEEELDDYVLTGVYSS